jgi:hypothetical protein
MAIFQGVLFLFFGVGLLIMDWQSLKSGWLPCGPKGLKGRLEFTRDAQPLGYWLMFVLYGAAGVWLVIFSVRLLTGLVEPLPLS